MWSVGRKRARLYLGSRVALLQVAEHALVTLEYPPTLPLSSALQQVALKSQQQGIDLSRMMLDIDLSASLCKGAIVPSKFKAREFAELSPEMRQTLSSQLPWPLEQCAWPNASSASGLLAVTTQGLMRNVFAWSETQKIQLGIVQPLWALITQSQRAKAQSINSVALAEPDGMTFLSTEDCQKKQAAWQFIPQAEAAVSGKNLRRQVEHTTAAFQFHSQAGFAEEPELKAWAGHWGRV